MRGDPLEQQGPFPQGLGDQLEVEHLQVTQAAVDELARTARCSAGPVLRLDQRDRQPARHRVEAAANSDHTTSDDQDVDLGGCHLVERVLARRKGKCDLAHDLSSSHLHRNLAYAAHRDPEFSM